MFARVNTLVTTQPASCSDSLTGMCAGPWRIEHELGRGGMGIVYAVEHVHIGKRAALKVLHRRMPDPERHAQRMLLEARVVNAIGHPNIVDVFDVGTTADGRPYIVMERLEGAPLSDVHVDRRRAVEILLEVCAALEAAHAAGVVHRDLKPDNIFVGEHDVTLLDWGIARMLHDDVHTTIEGQLVGTPQYISPEQARGEDVSPASDVYALGVVAYELFSGEAPFEAVSAAEVMAMHLYATPPPPELGNAALETLILDMLAKAPKERPTIPEVARRLSACIARKPTAVLDEPVELPPRRRWPVFAGAFALASSAAVFSMRNPSAIENVPATRVVAAATPVAAVAASGPECADPSVLHDGDRYFMTCTAHEGGNLFPIYQSTNLRDWQKRGYIFPAGARPTWATGNYWAPELHRDGDRITAYFSMRAGRGRNAIGVATAQSPTGPFTDAGEPVIAPKRGASDAHAFTDDDGKRYLYFKREGAPAMIAVNADGKTTDVLQANQAWEHGNVEAPWLMKHDGYYYLFFSGSRYCGASYAVGVARATSPLGPFEKLTQPIVASSDKWIAPGHVSIVDDRIVFHAYREPPSCDRPSKRYAQLVPLTFVNGWPSVAAQNAGLAR